MFKQLEYINYLNVNKDNIDVFYDNGCDFFYDRSHYLKDKLIVDLPSSFIKSPLYRKYTDFLINKGFNIVYKGICKNTMFGIPTFNERLVIVCSKSNNTNLVTKFLFSESDKYVTPLSLITGKPFPKLKKEINNLLKQRDYSSDTINDIYNYYIENDYDGYLMVNYLKDSCNLNDRKNIKFLDGSHKMKKGKKDDISLNKRPHPLDMINSVDTLNYYHYDLKKDYFTIREIARLNGVPDNWSIDIDDRDEFINLIHSMISPFIISKIWRSVY